MGNKGKWILGLFNQNLCSGDAQVSAFQPIVDYNLGNSWALSAGGAQWAVDWYTPRRANVPIGTQLGENLKIGPQLCRITVNPEYNAINVVGRPHWTIHLGFVLLVPAK